MDVDAPLGLDELVDFLLRLALGVEVGVDVTVATLVREAETAFVDVYSISGMGRMRAQA